MKLSEITVELEDGSKFTYSGRMAEHSLLFLAGLGFVDDLIEQAEQSREA